MLGVAISWPMVVRALLLALSVCRPIEARAAPSAPPAGDPIPQAEQTDMMTLPPATPHRVLVLDGVFDHSKDGRVYVVDADHARMLGMMPAAYNPNVVANPDGHAYYVGETIWTRGNRGTRQDLLSIYDSRTLNLTDEISLPGRALITSKKQDLDISADGHWVYVYNLTPSSSVILVDTRAKSVATTIGIPGCGLIFAWGAAGFSSICANGALSSVDISDPAHPKVTRTAPFFSPNKDAVFEQSPTDRATGRTLFISYSGMVTPATLGPVPKLEPAWSIQQAAGMPRAPAAEAPLVSAWRPGGWQLAALHRASGHLFVLMHQGPFWTHKQDGSEIWELDTTTHTLLNRFALPEPSGVVGVTQGADPLLMAVTDTGGFVVMDPATGKTLRRLPKLGDNLLFTTATGE